MTEEENARSVRGFAAMQLLGDNKVCTVCGYGYDWRAVRCPHCARKAKDRKLEWGVAAELPASRGRGSVRWGA